MDSGLKAYQEVAQVLSTLKPNAAVPGDTARLKQTGAWLDGQIEDVMPWLQEADHLEAIARTSNADDSARAGDFWWKSVWTDARFRPTYRSSHDAPMVRFVSVCGGKYSFDAWAKSVSEPLLDLVDASGVTREVTQLDFFPR
ncbi:MAG: hypothetical protein ACPGU1_22800 [Myxococcota bacterium]